jgi:predicted nucleic acid-binding protein
LQRRQEVLYWLHTLPQAVSATDREVLALVEQRRLWGRGIGWVDAHLLASALLTPCQLWTNDLRLHAVASALELAP